MVITIGFNENGFYCTSETLSIKRNKGKSLIELPEDYTIIDIETTGLMPLCDEIIELSAIKVRNNKIVDTFSSLVKPEMLEVNGIDNFITKLTGITYDMLKNEKLSKEVLPNFINFIADDIIVGYNVNFDVNFIYDDYKSLFGKDFKNNFVDLMRIIKKHCKNLDNYKLSTVSKYYNVDSKKAHRGLLDCNMTFEIYNLIKNEIISKYGSAKDFYKNEWFSNKKYVNTLKPTVENFDATNPLYNMTCVFTGTLSKMQRKDAFQIVLNFGGKISETLNKDTNLLIVGEQDYKKLNGKQKSNKMLKAEKLIINGCDLKIIPETAFYEMIKECINE